MSLLCLSGADVARVTLDFSPAALQTLMAHVFSVLSSGDNAENPTSYTPHRITIPTQNHMALFMPARIASLPCCAGPRSNRMRPHESGAVKAILNAANLTALRNAAGSLLSTNLVGPRGPTSIVAFGAGAQVKEHLLLHLRAFPSIRTCTIVNRAINDRASTLADLIRTRFPAVQTSCIANDVTAPSAEPALKDAVLSASLIICATSSIVPLFPSSWVADGTHIVLIGSYKPTMHEIDGALVRRAIQQRQLLVDSRAACLSEAGELIAAGVAGDEVIEIGELVSFDADSELVLDPARQSPQAGVTIFKSVGVGLQDVAIACAVVQKAEHMGLGRHVDWA
ncbi:hypothetical protein B0H17DRAFT_1080933 [Mycena rosella]|uniref:Ornithine cyclodeaminase n=1 Tax=Mycena rosella TaxID=1033263 RepID=A0AAD7GBM6_MYCRO|nr:hypothetical protein B0H17DRAFT_1080933 [Mycena rosella]